jgi:hypothetical protein
MFISRYYFFLNLHLLALFFIQHLKLISCLNEKVSSLKTELSTMTDKVQVLHQSYLKMKDEATSEIRHLKNVINDIKVINHKCKKSDSKVIARRGTYFQL